MSFPPIPRAEVKGIRAVRQGFHDYSRGTVVEGRDPRGFQYYWFGLEAIEHTLDHGTDPEAIDEGYISVTPPAGPDAPRVARRAGRPFAD